MTTYSIDNRRIQRTIQREIEKGKSFADALIIAVAQLELRRVRLGNYAQRREQ